MSDETTPKQYKYKLEVGIFEILLSKKDDEFERAKKTFDTNQIGGLI